MTQEFLFCGEVISEIGLGAVSGVLQKCCWRIELVISGYDGTHYLRTPHTQREIDLGMDSGQSHRFLFESGIDGTEERAKFLLGDFSRCLTDGCFPHRVELYDSSKDLVGYFHYRWPQEQYEPIA